MWPAIDSMVNVVIINEKNGFIEVYSYVALDTWFDTCHNNEAQMSIYLIRGQ